MTEVSEVLELITGSFVHELEATTWGRRMIRRALELEEQLVLANEDYASLQRKCQELAGYTLPRLEAERDTALARLRLLEADGS